MFGAGALLWIIAGIPMASHAQAHPTVWVAATANGSGDRESRAAPSSTAGDYERQTGEHTEVSFASSATLAAQNSAGRVVAPSLA